MWKKSMAFYATAYTVVFILIGVLVMVADHFSIISREGIWAFGIAALVLAAAIAFGLTYGLYTEVIQPYLRRRSEQKAEAKSEGD